MRTPWVLSFILLLADDTRHEVFGEMDPAQFVLPRHAYRTSSWACPIFRVTMVSIDWNAHLTSWNSIQPLGNLEILLQGDLAKCRRSSPVFAVLSENVMGAGRRSRERCSDPANPFAAGNV